MNRYSVILVLLEMLLYVAGRVMLGVYTPEYKVPGLIVIPLVFVLLGSVSIAMLKNEKGRGVNVIMGIKAVRFMMSMFVIGIYALACREHILEFVVAYGVFYLSNIVFETWMLLSLNRKKEKDNL